MLWGLMPSLPCPACDTLSPPAFLEATSKDAIVKFYRCGACGHVWTTTPDGSVILRHITPLKKAADDEPQTRPVTRGSPP